MRLCHTVPCCAVLCHTVPCCAMLCHAVPYCAVLCCAVLCHTVPCCAILTDGLSLQEVDVVQRLALLGPQVLQPIPDDVLPFLRHRRGVSFGGTVLPEPQHP